MGYRRSVKGKQVATCLSYAIAELRERAQHYPEGSDGRVRSEALSQALILLHGSARRCDAQWRGNGGFTRSFRFFKSFVLSLFLFVGCAFDAPVHDFEGQQSVDFSFAKMVTIEQWEKVFGRISDNCYSRSQDVIIAVVSNDEMQRVCPHTSPRTACQVTQVRSDGEHDFIFLNENSERLKRLESLVHETIHLLQWCEQQLHDEDHDCIECWEIRSGPDSIETKAEAELY